MLAIVLCAVAVAVAATVAADPARLTPPRLPLELGGKVTFTIGPNEPPFDASKAYKCQSGRRKQFSLHLPPKDFHDTGVNSYAPASVLSANTITCDTPSETTAGNTTICIVPANATVGKKDYCADNPLYAPAFVEHYPMFAPAFSRRPYIRESQGAVIAQLDLDSLLGEDVTLGIQIGKYMLNFPKFKVERAFVRFEFDLDAAGSDVDLDANITLTTKLGKAVHVRRFQRSPPPPAHFSVSVFQVDHETKGLLKDGIPFIMSGWFAGGYSHESAGLPPAVFTTPQRDKLELAALGQASLTTEWGRQGVTFIRAGRFGWANGTHANTFLDACSAAGVSVLWNVGADNLARAMAGIPMLNGKIGDVTQQLAWLKANVSMVKGHPAIGGYYACDDCCHMPVLSKYGPVEYQALVEVKAIVRSLDPYHLMFGSIACGETWYWTEEAAGLGMDVMMKEGYGNGVGNGNPYPAQYRVFPMTWEPIVLMPDPGALDAPHTILAHNYVGAITADMFHTNAFVMNNAQFFDWQNNLAISVWSAEATELLPSYMGHSRALFETLASSATGTGSGTGTPTHTAITAASATVVAMGTIPDANGEYPSLVTRLLVEPTPNDISPSAGYYCYTLVGVNPGASPLPVRFNISGIGPAPGGGEPLVATRLFHRQQQLNLSALTEGNGTVFTFTDFIDSQVANVYRIGCDVRKYTLPNPAAHETSGQSQSFNYIVGNGDLEADSVDILAPGRFSHGAFKGAWAGGYWVQRGDYAGAGTPPATDDRARVNADTADPHGGRYSAKINLGGGPRARAGGLGVQVTIPVNRTIPPQPTAALAASDFNLTLWARCSPPGVRLSVQVAAGEIISSSTGMGQGQFGNGNVTLGAAWQAISVHVRWNSNNSMGLKPTQFGFGDHSPSPIELLLRPQLDCECGGAVWLDDLSLRAMPQESRIDSSS